MQLNMTQAGLAKCPKIRHIVHIRQMLKQWRKEARRAASSNKAARAPSDVPAGHVAVCVGSSLRRFIVHATYLNHPIFKQLLAQTEEEFGFSNVGPLTIPCDEALFEEVLWIVSRSTDSSSNSGTFLSGLEDFQRCCRVGMKKKLEFTGECRPLLHHLADKSAC